MDDESIVRRSLKTILSHDGHSVEESDGAEAALAVFEPDKFDLVITDFSMQGMNGKELAANIRKISPGQRIIMISAFALELNTDVELTGLVDLILDKPFSLAEFRRGITQVCSEKDALKSYQQCVRDPFLGRN